MFNQYYAGNRIPAFSNERQFSVNGFPRKSQYFRTKCTKRATTSQLLLAPFRSSAPLPLTTGVKPGQIREACFTCSVYFYFTLASIVRTRPFFHFPDNLPRLGLFYFVYAVGLLSWKILRLADIFGEACVTTDQQILGVYCTKNFRCQ